MAVIYLALHRIVARFSRKPGSKLLWFFSVVTSPLTRPLKKWMAPSAAEDRLISYALCFYGLLWLFIVFVERFANALTD